MPSDKDIEQARFFANRVAKRDKHLAKQAKRTDSDCYRVYDRDIPEVPLSLDRYGSAAVLYLYERPYDKPDAEEAAWLELMAEAASSSLRISRDAVFVKTRKHLGLEEQYDRLERAGRQRVVRENGLSFLVNLEEYIDTGLFMDHRPARALVRSMSEGKRVLNLFCYTGSFSVYALAGGATQVLGVDLSNTYLAWAEKNISLNKLEATRYRGIKSDVSAFLAEAATRGERFDVIVLDPPTFSNSKSMEGFLDVVRHWQELVSACLSVLSPSGTILFSSSSRALKVDASQLPKAVIKDISEKTIPEDYRGHPHRTWLITHCDA